MYSLQGYMNKFFGSKHLVGAAVGVAALIVYLLTLNPTVSYIDSGELSAVAYTLGIAHPTGYPLFTLIGWVFAHLPLGFRSIFQLNLMAALFCAVGVSIFFQFLVFTLSSPLSADNPRRAKQAANKQKEKSASPNTSPPSADNITVLLSAGVGALVLAFSETFWSQAVSVEVYSLHLLMLSLVLLFFTRAIQDSSDSLYWFAFSFALGLAFTNHMTTILLAPGFLYLYFVTHGAKQPSWWKILRAVFPFLAGLSVYLYLPIRAAADPMLNWGDPSTLESFINHLRGKQYSIWIFSSLETAQKQLSYFVSNFPSEFGYLPVLAMVVGLFALFRSQRVIFWFTIILFVSCVFYAINYDIHDIDSYFLLAYMVAAVWGGFGVKAILEKMKQPGRRSLALTVCGIVVLVPLFFLYSTNDQSKSYTVEDYTMNMLDSFAPNAVVLSFQWDYWLSASYYYQLVEGKRPDVVVIDKELLRRSWYFKELENRFPWLIENSRVEVDAFRQDLYKFEKNIPYDARVIQARFEAMILSFLEKSYLTRPVYITNEIEPEFFKGFQKVPEGLAFRLSRDEPLPRIVPKEFSFRPIHGADKYTETIRMLYAGAYTNQAAYMIVLNQEPEKAKPLLAKALEVKPGFREALMWMDRLNQSR